MAAHELAGVLPLYEALCQAVAGSEAVCVLLDRLPLGKRQPNLLLGAVRFLGGKVDDPARFLDFVTAHWDAVADTMMSHRTQTNEPGRCATLLPLLASLPQPLALVEVGASAGLCLYPDRYSYRYTTSLGEHRLGDSQIVLSCAVTGPVPLPGRLPAPAATTTRDTPPAYPAAVDRLDEITGIGRHGAQTIIAEVGLSMDVFPTSAHLVSWSKISPREDRQGQPLPQKRPRRGRRLSRTHQHLPRRTLPAPRPTHRQAESPGRSRSVHSGHRLEPTGRPHPPIRRHRTGVLRQPHRARTPQTQPHPRAQQSRLNYPPWQQSIFRSVTRQEAALA